MTDNVKNIIEGINKTNKEIEEIQTEVNTESNDVCPMYSGLANGSAYQIYGEAAQDFPAD